jgi:hypothetical protein
MRELLATPEVDLIDVRAEDGYHAPDDYGPSQAFGEAIRNAGHDGIFYLSVRRRGGNNVVIYKPRRLLPVIQGDHYEYVWDAAGQFNAARLTGVR